MVFVGLLALVACAAGPSWVKQGASADDVERDIADCRFEAQATALAEDFRDPLDRDIFITDTPQTGRITVTPPGGETSRLLRQRELFERCMAERGYRLEGG